jgi:hypothetical protein
VESRTEGAIAVAPGGMRTRCFRRARLSPVWHGSVACSRSSVRSGAGARTAGAGGNSITFAMDRSPAGHGHVSSSRHVKRSVRFSCTALSCWLHARGYGTYHAGSAFGSSERRTRYPSNSLSSSYSQRLLHLFQPKPRRFRDRPMCRRISLRVTSLARSSIRSISLR